MVEVQNCKQFSFVESRVLGFIVNNINIIYYYYDHGVHMKKSMLKYYYLDL